MQARTVERVESWDSRPFTGGVRDLHELADADFSGAVSVGGTWLFLLNGRVVGVFGGDVDDVADADGTVYEAPHEALVLLYSMQERGGETQAKYYTNDTPLSEASQTLADANFTGYVELSENVLSGDYYVVYYGGRSMSAAFVGASEELITGDEAFERADDEVGVYEVMKTPVNVTELPPLDDGEDDDQAAGAAGGGAAGAGAAGGSAPAGSAEEPEDAAASTALSTGSQNDDAGDDGGTTTTADAAGDTTAAESTPESSSTESRQRSGQSAESPSRSRDTSASSGASEASRTEGRQPTEKGDESVAANDGGTTTAEGEEAFDEEREWRKTTSVPTIDPADSKGSGDGNASESEATADETAASGSTSSSSSSSRSNRTTEQSSGASRSRSRSRTGGQSTVEKLKQAVKQREQKLQAASDRIETLEGERDDLGERVETLEAERDELRSEVEDLEAELSAAEATGNGSTDSPGPDLNAVDALSDTNLFVRYDSKGQPTLDELDRTTDADAVNENLRIDHHTQFDAETATVDGEAFEAFLRDTTVFQFVSWAVRDLPYEVRDSGHQSGLAELYDALPRVDRAELNGTVSVEPDEETSVSRTFDVVLRDRMGNPLVVADVNTGRDPVTGDQMDALVSDASAIREGSDDLSAAMYVTGSFFEPAALETADEETAGGGFLSRNDRESFVKVGRKAGYQLCLVEDRDDAFHLTVPEL